MTAKLAHLSVGLILGVSSRAFAEERYEGLPRDEAALHRVLSLVRPDRFRVVDVGRFTVVHDVSDKVAHAMALRAEETRAAVVAFCESLKAPIRQPTHRLTIVFFDDYGDFDSFAARIGFKESGVAGVYDHASNVAAFVSASAGPMLLPVTREIESLSRGIDEGRFEGSAMRDRMGERLESLRVRRESLVEHYHRLVLQHEVAHQVFFNLGVHARGGENPAWLVEGLACQFEVSPSELAVAAEHANPFRLADFREVLRAPADAADESSFDWERAFRDGRMISAEKLISLDSLTVPSREASAACYAQAWALAHYLLRERREDFTKYLRLLADRTSDAAGPDPDGRVTFETAFGPIGGELDRAIVRHVLRLPFEPHSDLKGADRLEIQDR